MGEDVLNAFVSFVGLPDPRSDRGIRHELVDVIVIALCGALCGVDNAQELEDFGKARERWFRTFLELPHGIPSQGTSLRSSASIATKNAARRA